MTERKWVQGGVREGQERHAQGGGLFSSATTAPISREKVALGVCVHPYPEKVAPRLCVHLSRTGTSCFCPKLAQRDTLRSRPCSVSACVSAPQLEFPTLNKIHMTPRAVFTLPDLAPKAYATLLPDPNPHWSFQAC